MAQFQIFFDDTGHLAVRGFPDDDTGDEEIRVASISGIDETHTEFVLRNGHRIVVTLPLGEFFKTPAIDVEGTRHAGS